MRTSPLVVAAFATALLTLLTPGPARALGPIDIEVAGKAGYGTNYYGLGLGARAGISFLGLYGGINFVNYFGQGQGGQPALSAFTFGGEVGYGIKIAFVTIRPLLGLGLEQLGTTESGNQSFYIQPGGLVQFGFGHLIFGVEASALYPTTLVFGKAFTIDGQIGARF
jgi:hypothetical protein